MVFICEDGKAGRTFLALLIHRLRPHAPVWSSQGVDQLGNQARLARAKYPDAKILVIADGLGLIVDDNVEKLGRALPPRSAAQFV